MPVLVASIKPSSAHSFELAPKQVDESQFRIPYSHSLADAINSAKETLEVQGDKVVFPFVDDPAHLLEIGAPKVVFDILDSSYAVKGVLEISISE